MFFLFDFISCTVFSLVNALLYTYLFTVANSAFLLFVGFMMACLPLCMFGYLLSTFAKGDISFAFISIIFTVPTTISPLLCFLFPLFEPPVSLHKTLCILFPPVQNLYFVKAAVEGFLLGKPISFLHPNSGLHIPFLNAVCCAYVLYFV